MAYIEVEPQPKSELVVCTASSTVVTLSGSGVLRVAPKRGYLIKSICCFLVTYPIANVPFTRVCHLITFRRTVPRTTARSQTTSILLALGD